MQTCEALDHLTSESDEVLGRPYKHVKQPQESA